MTRERMRTLALVGVGLIVIGVLVMSAGGQWFSRGELFAAGGVVVLVGVGVTWMQQRRGGD